MNTPSAEIKRCLIVEDDVRAKDLCDRLSKYSNCLEVKLYKDAGSALDVWSSPETRPHAMILDIMMPYGSAKNVLRGDEDTDMMSTGLRLLTQIRKEEKTGSLPLIWVAITTARSPLAVGVRAQELLEGRGEVYYKPFNPHRLEDALVKSLGITSKVRPIFL
jgi:CheY-like chemotaxis protein